MIDPTAACSTTRKGLICKGFRCAKLMIEMEARNDSRLREGVDRRPVARSIFWRKLSEVSSGASSISSGSSLANYIRPARSGERSSALRR